MIARRVRGNSPHPSAEAPRRVKAGSTAIRPPECFDENVFGDAAVSYNPHHPSINLSLELPKQRFKGVLIALHEPLEEFAIQFVRHRPSLCFTCPNLERFQVFTRNWNQRVINAESAHLKSPPTPKKCATWKRPIHSKLAYDFPSGFANPGWFPHYYLFVRDRSALPLQQSVYSFPFICRAQRDGSSKGAAWKSLPKSRPPKENWESCSRAWAPSAPRLWLESSWFEEVKHSR